MQCDAVWYVTHVGTEMLWLLAVPWLRQLVTGLSAWRPGFSAITSSCRICGRQSGTGTRFTPKYFSVLLPLSLHQTSVLISSASEVLTLTVLVVDSVIK
jgi:hypothetical protein